MKNGSESVVHVAGAVSDVVSGVISKNAEYPNKPFVPSLVSQWQCKAVSLVEDAWQGIASALLAPFCMRQVVLIKAVSNAGSSTISKKNSRLTSRKE